MTQRCLNPSAEVRARAAALLLTLAAGLCCSCTHQVEAAYRSQHRNSVSTVVTQQVENAVNAGSGDPQMRRLRQRLAADAHDMDARITLARLYNQRGYPDLALEHYRMAMLIDPDSLIAALELAKALRTMKQTQAALEVVQFYEMRHPAAGWEIPSLEGVLEDELEQFAPAEKAHRAALKLEPNRSGLHNNLGYNLLLQGKPEAAAAEFRIALKIDPHAEIAHNNLGAALAAQSPGAAQTAGVEESPAPALAEPALQPQPEQPPTQPEPPAAPKKVSKSEAKRDSVQQALKEWERNADPAVAHNNLAALMIEQGRFDEARAELHAALLANPGFAPALANLALVSQSDGKPVTIPFRPKPVNFWKRFASTLGKLGGSENPAPKPAVSVRAQPAAAQTESAERHEVTSVPAGGAAEAGAGSVVEASGAVEDRAQ
jgi:Flp pilus assembly protein TadD